MTPEGFQQATGISDDVLARLAAHVALLEKWQRTINLVGRGSLGDVWRRHVLDSAQLAPHLPPTAKVIADIGSGAGFPGLVLAIMGPVAGADFHLIESDERKCAFLREANRVTQAGATIHHCRVENLRGLRGLKADLVVARSVAPLTKLLPFANPVLNKQGQCLFLKGKKWRGELTETQKNWIMKESTIRSMSDPSGMILKLEAITRRDFS
ncbi:MAG: 16S rRNA (guanine(527)-N(7))-methyltransferase RsmG [Rhodospirillales bacterium]